jgi:ATP-dependent exoDNAse (exonuclease V) beta subunit
VEWVSEGDVKKFMEAWTMSGGAGEEALACLRAPELAAVWKRPDQAQVWRERAFEVVIDGTWVTGVFDRVVIERDKAGHAVRATVFDFKTDRVMGDAGVAAAVAQYAGQLNLYRRVAAVLTGLDVAAVACELVLTKLRRLASV